MIVQVQTNKDKEILEITDLIVEKLREQKINEGVCHIFVKHTTAALTTGEVGEGTGDDLLETLERIIPKINFRHLHNPTHAPDHMIASILGPSLTIPIKNGELEIGRWQRILLVELNGPKSREVSITFLTDASGK